MYLLNNNKNKTIGFIFRQTDIYLLSRPNSIPPLFIPRYQTKRKTNPTH